MGRIFTYHIRNAKLRQFVVAQALANGAALHGDKVEIVEGYKGPVPGADGTILLG